MVPCPTTGVTVPVTGLILWNVSVVLVAEESYPELPALDVAVSHAVLEAVAEGRIGPVLRLHVPRRIVAFGMADRIQPGYRNAVRVASANGFTPVERLAGGRAAVFHDNTLAFSLATPEADPRTGITDRFKSISNMMCSAFRALKIDARVGEIAGEYCPGRYSVNVGGVVKVMGVGQRLVKGAAHVGGVIVVDDGASIRDVLIPVYRALRLDWDPRTAGALADRSAGTRITDVSRAVMTEFARMTEIRLGTIPPAIVGRARELAGGHLPAVA